MPVAKIVAPAVGRFRNGWIGEDKPSGERDEFVFQRGELLLLRRTQKAPVLPSELPVVIRRLRQKSRGIEWLGRDAAEIDRRTVLLSVPRLSIFCPCCTFQFR